MKIVLMSHFNLAEGLKSTLAYFNPYAAEQITAISAYVNDCDPKVEFEKVLAEVAEDEVLLVFTDIMGGSVNQLTIPYLNRPNFYVFAGMNLGMLLQALTKPGDGIVIQKPVYYPFMMMIENNGRRIVNNPLIRREEDGEGLFDYTMDFANLEEKMADPANVGMILSSPHNPVGRVWSREELTKVLEICRKYNKWIVADEIHCDLTRCNVVHTPMLKLAAEIAPDYCDHIVACVAPSKTFNLAGLAFSNIVIPGAEFQQKWTSFIDGQFSLGHGCNPLSLAGAMAAYNEGDEWLDQLKEYLDGNIEYIGQFIKEQMPKAKTAVCQGTYLLWVDMSGYCSDEKKLEYAMQQIGRVALDEGYIFGQEGAGYERINVAMPRSLVEDCMQRMKKAADWLEAQND